MDWHELLGIGAAVIQVASFIPYIRDMIKGSTRPNLVSFLLWTLTLSITISALWSAGASWPLALLVGAWLGTVSVAVLVAIGYGYNKFGYVEKISLVLSLAAIVLWQITSEPLVAIIFAVLADAIAYAPTLVKTYRDPTSESIIFWFAIFVADMLGAISTTKVDVANLLFPISYGLMNMAVVLIILLNRSSKRPLK
jgi:hypothetical protein